MREAVNDYLDCHRSAQEADAAFGLAKRPEANPLKVTPPRALSLAGIKEIPSRRRAALLEQLGFRVFDLCDNA